MKKIIKKPFDIGAFLLTSGFARHIIALQVKECAFFQGRPADSVFYLQTGRAALTVISPRGKEATVTLLNPGDFFGEEAICGANELRRSTATAIAVSGVLRVERADMLRLLHEEHAFCDRFLQFMLTRGMRTHADLLDQLFNSSERRLARTLLVMANFGMPGDSRLLIPAVTEKTLAQMIGATRPHVSFLMGRFRQRGYIEYNGRIRVNISLLDVVLRDELPEENACRAKLFDPLPSPEHQDRPPSSCGRPTRLVSHDDLRRWLQS